MAALIKEESITSVEHLDFEPGCAKCGNHAEAAGFAHGHRITFLCWRCVKSHKTLFETIREVYGGVTCTVCYDRFTGYDDFNQVKPL